jgi:hypothetical protein
MCQEIHAKQRGGNGCKKKIEFNVKTAESPRGMVLPFATTRCGPVGGKMDSEAPESAKKNLNCCAVRILEKNQILCWKKRHCGCGRQYGGGGQQV